MKRGNRIRLYYTISPYFLPVIFYSFIILAGKDWCCNILVKYPDLIPYITWGERITDAEKDTWKLSDCNNHVGGSSMDQCKGIEFL